jgi:hypothetical protein
LPRLSAERAQFAQDEELRVKRKRKREEMFNVAHGIGKQAQNMTLVTPENYNAKKVCPVYLTYPLRITVWQY